MLGTLKRQDRGRLERGSGHVNDDGHFKRALTDAEVKRFRAKEKRRKRRIIYGHLSSEKEVVNEGRKSADTSAPLFSAERLKTRAATVCDLLNHVHTIISPSHANSANSGIKAARRVVLIGSRRHPLTSQSSLFDDSATSPTCR